MAKPKRKAEEPSRIVTLKLSSNMLRGLQPSRIVKLKVSSDMLRGAQARNGSAYTNSNAHNDLGEHVKGVDARDGGRDPISRQDITLQPEHYDPTFLLEPDVTVALMLHGAEICIPWFSSELQKRAIAGVTDYFRFGDGCSWDLNQAFQIQHTIRFRPISTYPVDAVVQMRGWLGAWLEFYVLKRDQKCVDRTKALQATFGHLTSAHTTRRRRESAGVQSLVVQANDKKPDEHTDADVASKRSPEDTEFHKEDSPDLVIDTHKSTATPEIHRTELRENEDIESTMVSQGSQKSATPSRTQEFCRLASDSAGHSGPGSKTTARNSSMLRAREAEPQQAKTPVSEISGGKYESLCSAMRNGVLRNVEDELGNNSEKDCRFNNDTGATTDSGDTSMGLSSTLKQPVISPFLGHSTPTEIQREPQLSKAIPNMFSSGQTAMSPSNRAVLESTPPWKFFILQDPFGKMHTIPLERHWRIYVESLVELECCQHALDQVELVTHHRYDLFDPQGSKLTVDLLKIDIKEWDYVRMRFWEPSAAL